MRSIKGTIVLTAIGIVSVAAATGPSLRFDAAVGQAKRIARQRRQRLPLIHRGPPESASLSPRSSG